MWVPKTYARDVILDSGGANDEVTRTAGSRRSVGRLDAGRPFAPGRNDCGSLEKKMNVKAFRCADGDYVDIGTAPELNSALQRFHL